MSNLGTEFKGRIKISGTSEVPEGYTFIRDEETPASYYNGCRAKKEGREPTEKEQQDKYFMKGYREMPSKYLKRAPNVDHMGSKRHSGREDR